MHHVAKAGLSDRIATDSAGTHAYHIGEAPDKRAQEAASRRKVDLRKLKARRAIMEDFERFDYILAMDHSNLAYLQEHCPSQHQHKLKLFLEFAPKSGFAEVPDPYYGGLSGFERVLDLVEEASLGLIQHIRKHHIKD